ncbi:unnamed protein product [Arabis nemorensis]|uniref:CCHC-type domain-containing protein n=1 Tax=Arabis nemorensis TaxID=586526 RepID=A0A565C458_9BRAS|nr:unnamed protein product [Arabis nemorensis]
MGFYIGVEKVGHEEFSREVSDESLPYVSEWPRMDGNPSLRRVIVVLTIQGLLLTGQEFQSIVIMSRMFHIYNIVRRQERVRQTEHHGADPTLYVVREMLSHMQQQQNQATQNHRAEPPDFLKSNNSISQGQVSGQGRGRGNRGGRTGATSDSGLCFSCGEIGHRFRECPKVGPKQPYALANVTCFHCRENGHYANTCSTTHPMVAAMTVAQSPSTEEEKEPPTKRPCITGRLEVETQS